MNRTMLVLTVAAASYAACNIAVSMAITLAWRLRTHAWQAGDAATRARRLLWLRSAPSLLAMFMTGAIVVPAFALMEPHGQSEGGGPVLIALAACGVVQLAVGMLLAVVTAWRTYALERAWLSSASALIINPPAGVPAFAIESLSPIVALVGVFSPKLVAARAVVDACTGEELNCIVAHERGHLRSRDNLKRWLLACAPDALRWTRTHDEIVQHWHDAAEDAADDVASQGDARARTDLAALIVKIARLAPAPALHAATVSPFVEHDGLERRVRRLLFTPVEPAAPPRTVRASVIAALALTVVASAIAATPDAMIAVYDLVEAVVRLSR